ncbi:MAG: hypothetical protein RQ754_04225 [Desulfuromonadales bacterium]|nr:hypothetical protein [Desulfuromonadales bacterium]
MNQRLRNRLLPVFEYFELRTLVIALRYLAAGDFSSMSAQLHLSLLHPQIIKLLRETKQVALLTAALERSLAEDYPYFNDLTATYLRQGPGGLEQVLVGCCLQHGIARSRSRQVWEFLRYLLDMRNLQALYKHIRWQVPVAPPILSGGEFLPERYEKIWQEKNLTDLLELIRKRAKRVDGPGEEGVEDYLLRGLSARLSRDGRDPLQLGLVIDYLWRCQLEARTRGLELAGAEQFATGEAAG